MKFKIGDICKVVYEPQYPEYIGSIVRIDFIYSDENCYRISYIKNTLVKRLNIFIEEELELYTDNKQLIEELLSDEE